MLTMETRLGLLKIRLQKLMQKSENEKIVHKVRRVIRKLERTSEA